MRILALIGAKRSGKNTLADLVDAEVMRLGGRMAQVAMADAVRAAADAAGLPPAATRANKDEPCPELGGRPGRDFLIMLGMGARELYPAFWIDSMIRKLDRLETGGWRAVAITDLRFVNELLAVQAWTGRDYLKRSLLTVWIDRPGFTADEVMEPQIRHQAHVEVHNSGTVEDLRGAADQLARWCVGVGV